MRIVRWQKVVLGVGGPLLLGALGSGLWELLLRPAGQWLGRTILTGVTLGSSAAKDAVYREAAKGFHEASALQAFLVLILLSVTFLSAPSAFIFGLESTRSKKSIDPTASPELKHMELAKLRSKRRSLLWASLATTCLLWATLSISWLELIQANSAYTYFSQSITICAPYMDDRQMLALRARFASIHGRSDYLAIAGELSVIAKVNHQSLPDYTPW